MVHLYYLVPVKKEAVAAAMMNKQRMQWLAYCSRKATLHRNTSCSCCCLNSVFFLRGMLLPELLSCSCWTGPQATSACVRCCALHHRCLHWCWVIHDFNCSPDINLKNETGEGWFMKMGPYTIHRNIYTHAHLDQGLWLVFSLGSGLWLSNIWETGMPLTSCLPWAPHKPFYR